MSFTISGKVVGGNKLGRELGFPTANIAVGGELPIKNGAYAATVTINNEQYRAMANLGHKPSVGSNGQRVLEVNIFDFNRDIYGLEITIELLNFIRDEQTFTSFAALRIQITQDKAKILEIFNNIP